MWVCLGTGLDMLESLGVLGMYSMHRRIRISSFTSRNDVILNNIGFGAPLPKN